MEQVVETKTVNNDMVAEAQALAQRLFDNMRAPEILAVAQAGKNVINGDVEWGDLEWAIVRAITTGMVVEKLKPAK